MTRILAVLLALLLAACGADECKVAQVSDAEDLALREKARMLARSTDDYAVNFASNDIIETRMNDNGYVAKVSFRGKDGSTLMALIEGDCYVGWTASPAQKS